jgi:hypothetical protein
LIDLYKRGHFVLEAKQGTGKEEHQAKTLTGTKRNTNWEIQTMPVTQHGTPDILIGDLLVLELKVDSNKGERDRVVGQCAGYSRQWVTWMVLVDASASHVGQLEDLLTDKGLERILVWNFS